MVAKLLSCTLHKQMDREQPEILSNQGQKSYVNFWKDDFVFYGTVCQQILAKKRQYISHLKLMKIILALMQ